MAKKQQQQIKEINSLEEKEEKSTDTKKYCRARDDRDYSAMLMDLVRNEVKNL